MYFPLGWPKYLKSLVKGSKPLQYVISSCDRMLFAVITEDTLCIWYSKPSVLILSYTHPYNEICSGGSFKLVEWKPDSSMIAIMTSKQNILFFKVELDVSVPNHHCLYVQHEGKNQTPKRDINGIPDSDSIPAIKVTLLAKMQLPANIICCLCVREEIMVSTEDGCLHRIKWNASVNKKASFHIRGFPSSLDFQQTKASKLTEEDGCVQQMEYSPIIGGYTLVLSSGKALFVIPSSTKVDNSVPQGVWVTGLMDATCVAVNHRYRLMAFGCKSGIGAVYVINEVEGTIELSYKLQISSKDFPDAAQKAGAVKCMKWTPDGTAVAVCWKNGGFSLWSVFGALLLCSLGGDLYPSDSPKLFPPPVKSMEWGLEGYQLWMVCEEENRVNGFVEVEEEESHTVTNVMQLQFVKSALTVNPCMTNHEHVFLQGEDRLYMSISDGCSSSKGGASQENNQSSLMSIGNKIWQIVPISHIYLGANWPIRYAAVDKSGQCVAVAGKTGLAHYTFATRKWKLFGNETQEKDLVVSGGMTWWKDFICVACYNIIGQRDEIRCYPKNTKLDNTFAVTTKVPSQILLLNTFRDILIIFCIDSHVMLFNMERKNSQKNPLMELIKVQEVSLNSYIPHPVCVTGLALTSLRTENFGNRSTQPSRDSECLLLNVAGKLLMFQRDETGPQIQGKQNKPKAQPFGTPAVVATNVENMWSTSRTNQSKTQLMEALWLGCGAQGMKVWLPLYPRHEGKTHNFMSKRIMLPFRVDIYPLAVLFEDAVILGAASDGVIYKPYSEDGKRSVQNLPFCILERTSQIYLHHILRQLLRRNLGVNALDLARCCTELSYFPHVLELLLHEVLEAEATSKEPIPDPLLPRVVAFIQEFPEFLQTIVHCARKTEVALWPHLFSVVGNPKDLFEQCIVNEELETAASYLIILQNLERPIISRQHATLLLDQSLERGKWDLARDLVRFLKAIDPSEASTPPILASTKTSSSKSYHSGVPSPPILPNEADGFSFSNVSNVINVSRMRSSSMTGADYSENVPKGSKPKLKHTFSDNIFSVKKPLPKPKEEGAPDQMYIDMILCRHCRKLLETNCLRDMGYFSANTDDFHLVSFLKRERLKGAKVEDFVRAVKDIHHQFEWPLPILSYHVFQQLKSKTFSTSSLASLSLLDGENLPTVNVGAHNNDTDYHRYLGTLQPPSPLNLSQAMSDDVVLKPQAIKTEESSLATTLDISDTSSLFGDLDYMTESSLQDTLSPELEILSQEMANKGPRQSEMELRYLLQILLEAGCLEWAMIISLVLRDVEAVVRTVNTASMTDTPLEMVARMREGISYLELWADTECLGYKPFLHFIRKQIQVLGKLAEQTPPTLQLSSSVMEDHHSDDEQLSPEVQTIHTKESDSSPDNSPLPGHNTAKSSECVIS